MKPARVWSTLALSVIQAVAVMGGARELYGQSGAGRDVVRASAEGVSVEVDPRIELMTVIQILADYPVLTSEVTPYRVDVTEYFGGSRDHAVVSAFRSMFEAGFNFDVVPKAFVSMSALPELELRDDVATEVMDRAGGRAVLERFARLAAAFARDAGFAAFFSAHEGTYEAVTESALPAVVQAVDQLAEYTGMEFPSARVVLSPLLHDGGFAMTGGDPDAQAFIGPVGVGPDGFPDFGGPDRLGPLLWHEFSHTVINPLTEQAAVSVSELEIHDASFREQMRRNAYADWATIVNESIIRALEVRLATRVLGDEAGERLQARQAERGFRHVPALAEALKEYEANRAAYPRIADYYPRLLQVFR